MPKIAFVSTMEGAPWGGSEELWGQTAVRMAQAGIRVKANVVQWPDNPQVLQELEAAGGSVIRRPHSGHMSQKIMRRLGGERIYQWLTTNSPDLVIISQGTNTDGLTWMEECKKRSLPFAVIAQAAIDTFWPDSQMASRLAEAYGAAQASFFVSQGILELTERQIAERLPNAAVVRNPFGVFYNAVPTWPQEDKIFRLACVGRLAPSAKGQDILLEVLSLDKWHRRALGVTFFGNGPNRDHLAKLAEMLNVKNVEFGGFVKDVRQIWASHHALVLPSRYEGLPLVVVEAMLCGRMCIVTDVPGNAELIEDNVTGFIAAAPKNFCLDEALERAWQARMQWQQMGQTAAKQVRQAIPADPIAAFVEKLMPLLPSK